MKKLSVICLLVVGIILISGCIDEEKTNSKTSTNSQSSMNETSKETLAVPDLSQPELMSGEFDINITSYYFVYMRDNEVISKKSKYPIPTFDLFEKNYVIYHLSIINNDTNALNFSINKLQLHTGNQVFTPADPGIIHFMGWVSSEIENENKLNDTLLHPDQNLEGIVIFQVDNYTTLFDRSFLLRYNTTSIPSTSYEKSLEALTVAEQFDYSIAFHILPYDNHQGGDYSYYPEPDSTSVWANWVNRTVFEYYKKYDEMSLPKQKPENIPSVEIAYAVKVIPEQDLTICGPNYRKHGEIYKRTQLYVVDDTEEELFNRSIGFRVDGLAILDNQAYRPFQENMPQMFIPQATIVHISFYSFYESRLTHVDQDIILDEQHNIILARYDNLNTHAM
jgi:hypothetical protein